MARRSHIPPHVRAHLADRASAGRGHDMRAATLNRGTVVSAYQARLADPSPEMLAVVRDVMEWIADHGGVGVGLQVDIRFNMHPGCITVCWNGDPTALTVAEQFAVGRTIDGLPQIPGWLSLRNDDNWDLRWQVTYGPIHDPATPAQPSPWTEPMLPLENLDTLDAEAARAATTPSPAHT